MELKEEEAEMQMEDSAQAAFMKRLRQKKLEQLGQMQEGPVKEAIIEEEVEEGGGTSESGSVGMDIGI